MLDRYCGVSEGGGSMYDIPQERRFGFYMELKKLLPSEDDELPHIDYIEGDVTHELVSAALRCRSHPEHGERVTKAIGLHFPDYDEDTGKKVPGKIPEHAEIKIYDDCEQEEVLRDIAKAMKIPVIEFVRKLVRETGEPMPDFVTRGQTPIVFLSLSQAMATTPPPDFLVDGLIPDRRVTLAHGKTDAGKTYLTLELAAAVAGGWPALEHFKVNHQGLVIYFAGEDYDDILHGRLAALQKQHGSLDGKLKLVNGVLPLYDDGELERYLSALTRATE
jgi:hypothetical protein